MPRDIDAALADYVRVRRSAMAGALESALDLSIAQLKALIALHEESPITVGRLAHQLGTGLPAASLLVDRLARAGWVERADDAADRRRVLLRLTNAGEEVVERFREGRSADLRDWMSELDDADFKALARGLRALAAVAARRSRPAEISA
jgi:DNA-binding MarR family transcriptional regulator